MKTIESMRTLCSIDRDAFRAEIKVMQYNIEQLDKAISDAVANGKSVRESAKQLIKEIDETAALVTVASLINRFSWDGRISKRNADRAATVENAWSGDAMTEWGCYCHAHMAHLDQIADYILDGLKRNKLIDEICSEFAADEVKEQLWNAGIDPDELPTEDTTEAEQTEVATADQISKQDTLVVRANGIIDTYSEQADADKDRGRYDYLNAVKLDVAQYIHDNVNLSDYEDIDELREKLNDDLWIEDNVTGNGSGSYTFSRQTAKEYVVESGIEYLVEAMTEFGQLEDIGPKMAAGDWEFLDVTIRCYLLGQAIDAVLDDLGIDNLFQAA